MGGWHVLRLYGIAACSGQVTRAVDSIDSLMFLHVFFAPYKRLRSAIKAEDFQEGAKHLATIRTLIGINLLIGLIVIVTAIGLEHTPI